MCFKQNHIILAREKYIFLVYSNVGIDVESPCSCFEKGLFEEGLVTSDQNEI